MNRESNSILEAIEEYDAKYRHDGLPSFEISKLYDLFPTKPHTLETPPSHMWPVAYPYAERAGVYLIFSELLDILYIGKASMGSCIGKRLWTYFHFALEQECILKHSTWTQPPRFLMIVAVPEDMPFEAPALEEFLIGRLLPPDNSAGV